MNVQLVQSLRFHELRAIQLSLLRDISEGAWQIEKVDTGLGAASGTTEAGSRATDALMPVIE